MKFIEKIGDVHLPWNVVRYTIDRSILNPNYTVTLYWSDMSAASGSAGTIAEAVQICADRRRLGDGASVEEVKADRTRTDAELAAETMAEEAPAPAAAS